MDEENETPEIPAEPTQTTSSGSTATPARNDLRSDSGRSPLTGEGIPVSDVPAIEPEAISAPEIITEVKPLQNTVTITEIMEPPVSKNKTLWKSFLEKVSFNKKKKLDRIMAFVTERGKISNDDVEKLLKVSDATARRYLDALEKQGKLQQVGNVGRHAHYIKI